MKFRNIFLFGLLLSMSMSSWNVRAQNGQCPDDYVRNVIGISVNSLDALATSDTALQPSQIQPIEAALQDLLQNCFPTQIAIATNTPSVTQVASATPSPPTNTRNILSYRYIKDFHDSPNPQSKPLSGVSVNSCAPMTIIGDEQNGMTHVSFIGSFGDPTQPHWVNANLFAQSFPKDFHLSLTSKDADTPLLRPNSPLFDRSGGDAEQVVASIRDSKSLTIVGMGYTDAAQPDKKSRMHVKLDNGREGWVEPAVLSPALKGLTVTTSYPDPGINVRTSPEVTQTNRVGTLSLGEDLDILDINDDGTWWKIAWHEKAWVPTNEIAPRTFTVTHSAYVAGGDPSVLVKARETPSWDAKSVVGIPPGTEITIKEVVPDTANSAWIRFETTQDKSQRDVWLNTCILALPSELHPGTPD